MLMLFLFTFCRITVKLLLCLPIVIGTLVLSAHY